MIQNKKKLILFVNLGSPDKAESKYIRKYLKEFLSDRHVIDLNPFFWNLILRCFILPFRPKKIEPLYKSIWKDKSSPLLFYTKLQTEKIRKELGEENIVIDLAMRYGNPSIEKILSSYNQKEISDILIVPLFPQYSNTTVGSIIDKSNEIIRPFRNKPYVTFFKAFYDKSFFYNATAQKIRTNYEKTPFDLLVLSYHGIPQRYAKLGDPYYQQCIDSTTFISNQLNDLPIKIETVFQSRFGKEPWLQPYCDEYISKIAREGIKSVAIHSPSFLSDCLETTYELGEEIKTIFMENGGKKYVYIESLNDDQFFLKNFAKELKKQLS